MRILILSILLFTLQSCLSEDRLVCATKDITDQIKLKVEEPSIFTAKCAICHMLDKNSTGPKLFKVFDRLPNEKWFEEFVKNEDSLLNIGDQYAQNIQNWSPARGNHNFKNLTELQIAEIRKYLDQE